MVIAGQQDRQHLAQDPMLSADIAALAQWAVKDSIDVQHAFDLPLLLRRAFDTARRPPAGPVFLSVPMDILTEDVAVTVPARSRLSPPAAAGGLADAAEMLGRAGNAAIVAGDGVGRGKAVRDLVRVAEALGAAVFHQPMFDGIDFPPSHPLYWWTCPSPATRPTDQARTETWLLSLLLGLTRAWSSTAAGSLRPAARCRWWNRPPERCWR